MALLANSWSAAAQTRGATYASLQGMNDETLFRTVTRELSDDSFGGRKRLTRKTLCFDVKLYFCIKKDDER